LQRNEAITHWAAKPPKHNKRIFSRDERKNIVESYTNHLLGLEPIALRMACHAAAIRRVLVEESIQIRQIRTNPRRTRMMARCHSDLPNVGHGLCCSCYNQEWRKKKAGRLNLLDKATAAKEALIPAYKREDVDDCPQIVCEQCNNLAFLQRTRGQFMCFSCRWVKRQA
jgi:hypothetical protein